MKIIFVLLALVIYGGANYYFMKHFYSAIALHPRMSIPLTIFLSLLIISPIVAILLSYGNFPLITSILSYIGYSWLAFIFLFIITQSGFDLIFYTLNKLEYNISPLWIKNTFLIISSLCFISIIYGYFEANNIKLETVNLTSDKLTKKNTLKIMQISDVHFSPLASTNLALKIKKAFDQEKPDIILSTGDLLDKAVINATEVQSILSSLNPPLGKYAITGNHEFLSDINYSIDFTKKCGFTIIRDTLINIDNKLVLIGIDDNTKKVFTPNDPLPVDVELLMQNENLEDTYTIFLKHQPKFGEESFSYFDLALSGHTHAGQIFPFSLFVKIAFKYLKGLYKLDNETNLYVSRGTGSWGPPIRILAPPEITILNINKTATK